MTGLAHQQLLTAWVSAGAAVIQAVGAVGAIAVAIKLARDSEKRSAAAEKASAEREAAADRAAQERAAAADRAAAERIARATQSDRNRFVDSISALARDLLTDTDRDYHDACNQYATYGGTIGGGYTPARSEEILALTPNWKLRADDPNLLRAINELERSVRAWKPQNMMTAREYTSGFQAYRNEIERAIIAIEQFHVAGP